MTSKRLFALIAACSLIMVLAVGTAMAAGMTAKEMVQDARTRVNSIDINKAQELLMDKEGLVVLDVREPSEFKAGHLPMAINLARGLLEFKIGKKITDKNTPILAYCRTGGRSSLAADTLMKMGYTEVYNMNGGFNAWKKAGFPVE